MILYNFCIILSAFLPTKYRKLTGINLHIIMRIFNHFPFSSFKLMLLACEQNFAKDSGTTQKFKQACLLLLPRL